MAATTSRRGPLGHQHQLLNRVRRFKARCAGSSEWSRGSLLDRHRDPDLRHPGRLDKVAVGLLDDHAKHCLVGGASDDRLEEFTDELVAAVSRLMRRG